MSPIAKLNAGTFFFFICIVLLPNAAGLGGAPIRSPDETSVVRASPQLTP